LGVSGTLSSNSPGNVLLEAKELGRVALGTGQSLLRGVSLSVRRGERLAIVGPTGSGKTLLLRSLALLDPIDQGEILWLNQPISARAVPDFRRQVGYVHQRPALIEGTVEDNLRLPFAFGVHAHEAFDRDRILSMMESVDRGSAFLSQSWRDLSGGEAQIVALIRVLQLRPIVLLLDEPTASLDAATAKNIEQLLAYWHQQVDGQRATVWVTHDRAQSSRVATRVLRMNSGRLIGEP
jgi:putative ABC transport system ATP-binding protein